MIWCTYNTHIDHRQKLLFILKEVCLTAPIIQLRPPMKKPNLYLSLLNPPNNTFPLPTNIIHFLISKPLDISLFLF